MGRQPEAPFFCFYKERLGTGSPPHPTRLRRPTYGLWWLRLDLTEQSPGLFDPQGEGFGGRKLSSRISNTSRPTDSPGRAHPAGPGGSPQKDPKGPTHLSAPPTRPAGHASQSSAGRSRRKKFQSYFPRACTGEKIPLTPRVPAPPARFGVQPPILGGASHQAGNLTPPYSALPNEGKSQVPLPKFLTPRSSAPPPYPNPAASSER